MGRGRNFLKTNRSIFLTFRFLQCNFPAFLSGPSICFEKTNSFSIAINTNNIDKEPRRRIFLPSTKLSFNSIKLLHTASFTFVLIYISNIIVFSSSRISISIENTSSFWNSRLRGCTIMSIISIEMNSP